MSRNDRGRPLLGVMVAIIQTLIFTLLAIVYVGMAIEHAEH